MTKWPETEAVKKLSLEISQISQENAFARVSFLIKLQAKTCNFIRKETQAQMFSCEFCKNFKNTFFHRTHYDVVLLFLLLTLNIFCTFFSRVSVVDFEQLNVSWFVWTIKDLFLSRWISSLFIPSRFLHSVVGLWRELVETIAKDVGGWGLTPLEGIPLFRGTPQTAWSHFSFHVQNIPRLLKTFLSSRQIFFPLKILQLFVTLYFPVT